MAIMITSALIMWLTVWIGYEMCKYTYNLKIRPYASDWIYSLEAHWELHKQNVRVKAKELKKRDNAALEVVPHSDKPRCWEWKTNYSDNAHIPFTTELIPYDDTDR